MPTSVRIPRELLKKLQKAAKRKGISTNALMVYAIAKYIDFDLFIEGSRPVTLAGKSLLSITGFVTHDEMGQAGDIAGADVLKPLFNLHNIKPSLNTIVENYIKLLSIAGWFSYEYHAEEGKVVMNHDLGIGWSHFVAGHLRASIRSVLYITPKINLTGNSITLYFK